MYCKCIGLWYTLGEAINHSKRDGVDRNGSWAGNTYRTQEAHGGSTFA